MKEFLEAQTITHDGQLAFSRVDPDGKFPRAFYPVIRKHPVAGEKVIFVNRGSTIDINELSLRGSCRRLDLSYQHVEEPYFAVRFRWGAHSVARRDSRCTQHLAIWGYYRSVRYGFCIQTENQPRDWDSSAHIARHFRDERCSTFSSAVFLFADSRDGIGRSAESAAFFCVRETIPLALSGMMSSE